MRLLEMSDIRCVSCGCENISAREDKGEIVQCAACGTLYPGVLGVPFLGKYEKEDILGLVEIASNIVNRGKFSVTPAIVEEWERLLLAYDRATDKAEFITSNAAAQSQFLQNRYGEWLEIARLTENVDLHEKKVLDIGAGLGFDSHRLSMRGANVTALEFSPILAESGKINFSHIRWVGGFSHCLPFKSASFDGVFCNAALHHMRDVPAAISEALRVLRPGGVLITTCDSFLPSNSGDDVELEIFNAEPAVLLGVNEGVPRFSDFVSTLKLHPNLLDIELYTHTLFDAPMGGTLSELTQWQLGRDEAMLSSRSGSLAMRVRLKAAWPEPAKLQTDGVLSADQYVGNLNSAASALAKLAPLLPSYYINLPFPGDSGTKFELLNGWHLPKKYHQSRVAHQRGRWFLSRSSDENFLVFELGLPETQTSKVTAVAILLNGELVEEVQIGQSVWKRYELNVTRIPIGQTFAVEIQQRGGGEALGEAAFVVRNRRWTSVAKGAEQPTIVSDTRRAIVYAVIPVFNRLAFTLQCIQDLKRQTYQPVRIIVADGGSTDGTVQAIRTEHPDVVMLTSETELWWAGAMAMGVDHILHNSESADDYLLMMNNDTQIPVNYVDTLVSAAETYGAAVGALVVDSRDTTRILDAGEYIDWASYSFPVKNTVAIGERFCDDVSVLPGRGSLIPLQMIRTAGNVDADRLPHYLADYEFFYRLKRHGFRLGVCYETQVMAHIDETGLVPTYGKASLKAIWNEKFSRRSMSNVFDHWYFVGKHAPAPLRTRIRLRLIRHIIIDFTLRTPLRPFFLPLYWLIRLPYRLFSIIRGQQRAFKLFAVAIREQGVNVLCNPYIFPRLIRLPLYFLASPGPLRTIDIIRSNLSVKALLSREIVRPISGHDWYVFNHLNFSNQPEASKLYRLFWAAWNPFLKIPNSLKWRKATREKVGHG